MRQHHPHRFAAQLQQRLDRASVTAVYAWYPKRYDAEDAFRMGNYSLLAYAAQNVGLEFIYSGPHSLLSRMHLNNGHRAPEPGTNPGSNP